MDEYEPSTYGERIADVYDEWYPDAPPAMIDRLAKLAGEGRVLELAIGTGRVALPLLARGVDIHGVDVSGNMVARLRAKQDGDRIPVSMGDFADVPAEGPFALVFIVFNTLFALLTQQDQVRCFRNVADRLEPGGAFVVEAFVPDLTRFDRGQRISVAEIEEGEMRLEAAMHDPVAQVVTVQHISLGSGGVQLRPVVIRYAWPAELDLMAALAGMELEARWGDWEGSAFTTASTGHVSVYRVAAS
jgi:SAM-dependent methyltransferase